MKPVQRCTTKAEQVAPAGITPLRRSRPPSNAARSVLTRPEPGDAACGKSLSASAGKRSSPARA
ncbi:MAG: hypothetical protein JXB85_16900 [Anaerolineales bacterium]|nr:hypothetical protein [Anaerolineales bacterium]